jgi:4-amino-4-deoxy-L-arabinose transferase-like glycosyltransferase
VARCSTQKKTFALRERVGKRGSHSVSGRVENGLGICESIDEARVDNRLLTRNDTLVLVMLDSVAKWRNWPWFAPAVVFLLALVLFFTNLDRPPHPDELHHVLAAQHLLETGRPILAEGEYWRGILHTWMVATSYEIFGEGLASARLPAVFLVALVAPILFLWVQREAGYLAAWLAAALFISSPFTVEIAQFSRFYALQMFSFVFGSMCVYYTLVATMSVARRALLGVLAIAFLGLALSVQVTSLVGMIGIAVWALGSVAQRVFFDQTINRTLRRCLATALILAGSLVILAASQSGTFEWAWANYRETPLFNIDTRNEFWFYHIRFLVFYPTLWPLVGILALLAVVRSPKLAWFAVSVFGISFLLMSFAGTKNTRYLSFAPPFLAILWGIGLAHAFPRLSRISRATRIRLIDTLSLPPRLRDMTGTTIMVLALLIVVLMNSFWLRTGTLVGNVALPFETPAENWRAAREALAPWTADADIMITTEELGAIYFLGRSDVRFSPSKLPELREGQRKEFGIDYRTGHPVISKPESVEKLIDCFERGIIVGPVEHWGDPIRINKAVQNVVTRYAKPIEVPKESYLYAWGWEREFRETRPSYCSDLSQFSGRQTH